MNNYQIMCSARAIEGEVERKTGKTFCPQDPEHSNTSHVVRGCEDVLLQEMGGLAVSVTAVGVRNFFSEDT